MRFIVFAESELVLQVVTQLRNLGNVGLEGGVDLFLGSLSGRGKLLGIGLLSAGEEGIIDGSNVNTSQLDLGGSSNDVSLVDTAKRDTVDAIRT